MGRGALRRRRAAGPLQTKGRACLTSPQPCRQRWWGQVAWAPSVSDTGLRLGTSVTSLLCLTQQSPFHHCSAKTSLSGGEGQEGLGFSSQHESYVLISSFKKNNDAAFIHEAWSAESGQNLLFDPAHSFLFSFFPKTGERCMWRGEGTCVS